MLKGLWAGVCLAALASAQVSADLARQAAAAREANDLPRALELYRQGTAGDPGWQEGWWALGSLYYDASRYREAIEALSKLVRLNPQSGLGFGLLGLSEFEAGQYPQSRRDVEQALTLGLAGQDQMEGVLRFHKAELLALSRNFDASLGEYGWFVQRGVHHDTLLTALGAAALHQAVLPEKLPAPDRPVALAAGKAAYLSMSGAIEPALSAFRDLTQQFPTVPNVHFLLANLLVGIDVDAAETELRNELKVAPQNAAAQALLAYLLLEQDDGTEAAPLAAAAYRSEPEVPFTQFVYGRSLAESGDLNQGLRFLQMAVDQTPNVLVQRIALAAALAKAGRPEQARRERSAALTLAKGSRGPQ